MPEPTFWHIQSNPDVSLGRKKVIDILEKTSLIGLNFEKGSSTYNNFKDRMQLGDIVLVRDGIQPIALVEVNGKWEQKINPDEDLDWFSQRRKIRVLEYAAQETAIADAARELVAKRDEWLTGQDRKPRHLTRLYNERPTWLDLAHKKLDAAVFAAYGWDPAMTDDTLLAALLTLNHKRANSQT